MTMSSFLLAAVIVAVAHGGWTVNPEKLVTDGYVGCEKAVPPPTDEYSAFHHPSTEYAEMTINTWVAWTEAISSDIPGDGFAQSKEASLEACKEVCQDTTNCQAIQFSDTERGNNCLLHDNKTDGQAQKKAFFVYKITERRMITPVTAKYANFVWNPALIGGKLAGGEDYTVTLFGRTIAEDNSAFAESVWLLGADSGEFGVDKRELLNCARTRSINFGKKYYKAPASGSVFLRVMWGDRWNLEVIAKNIPVVAAVGPVCPQACTRCPDGSLKCPDENCVLNTCPDVPSTCGANFDCAGEATNKQNKADDTVTADTPGTAAECCEAPTAVPSTCGANFDCAGEATNKQNKADDTVTADTPGTAAECCEAPTAGGVLQRAESLKDQGLLLAGQSVADVQIPGKLPGTSSVTVTLLLEIDLVDLTQSIKDSMKRELAAILKVPESAISIAYTAGSVRVAVTIDTAPDSAVSSTGAGGRDVTTEDDGKKNDVTSDKADVSDMSGSTTISASFLAFVGAFVVLLA